MAAFDKNYLIRKTGVVSTGRAVGVLSGLILDAVILAVFGLGKEMDAFFAALAIPILIDGTLSIQFTQVLVPILASVQKESGQRSAWDYLSNLITVWLLVVSLVSCAAMAIAMYIMPLQVPGLGAKAIALAGHMNMLLVWLLPLSGLAAMLQGALFSAHRFWVTSTTKAINNLCIISAVLLLHRGVGIYALAMGYLAGFATQCLVLWFALRRCGFSYRWNCNCRDPRLKDTVKLVLYPLAGQMLGECRTLVENFFASFYAPGVLSALRYASRIIYALSGVLMSSVVTATTPMVAHHVAEKDFNGMKCAVRNGIKLLLFMSVPVCLWLTFTGDALISLLFQRGQFSQADAALTASLMALMAPYILFSRAISITQTPFYAVKDTRTLMFSMMLSFGLYVLITPLLLFGLGVYGLPLATSASTALGAVVMCLLLRRSFGPMDWIQLRTFSAQFVGAVAIACAGFFVGRELWLSFAVPGLMGKLFAVGVPSVIGMIAFFGGALVFGLIDRGRFPLPFGLGKHDLATSSTADSVPKP